jgi:integrase
LEAQNVSGRYFKPLLRATDLPNLSLYGLRHSHATLLLAVGEHPKVVQERLGHSASSLRSTPTPTWSKVSKSGLPSG